MRPIFNITVHNGDTDIIETLHECVGIGRINHNPNHHQSHWDVSGWEKCEILADQIIDALDGSMFVETSKYEQFLRWVDFMESYETPQNMEQAREALETAKNIPSTTNQRGKSVDEWMERLNYPGE